ncbi:hypothetical protein [Aureimonas jatrophae]|uniref:Uncharacterized protein n=1 Tax=Aureimonas jatrophae TaxID=1166073 RepID=A0A1H0HTJ9_9HYPH|nr:hypothetical protein [Aureimonas jatrophae]MBB3950766.1 hypothetical protein [Aureimonas jatrophae]SDO22410.1 hypothetical protein SAMN05192530_104273 [Aureimonas jatrophae]
MNETKITDGLNDRSRDAPIGQTAGGLPDDTSRPVEVDEAEVARVRDKLMGDKLGGDDTKAEAEVEAHPS